MDAKIFVYVAHKDGKADDSAIELANAARTMFPGSAPIALVAGSGVDAVCGEVATLFGEVWKFDQAALAWLERVGWRDRNGAETYLAPLLPDLVTPGLVAFESLWASNVAI